VVNRNVSKWDAPEISGVESTIAKYLLELIEEIIELKINLDIDDNDIAHFEWYYLNNVFLFLMLIFF